MTTSSRIDATLRRAVEAGDVAGVSVVVIDRDGQIISAAAGERRLGSGAAMTADTVGRIYSMTKALTAAAAMHAVERGLLDLDGPAARFHDGLADRRVLEGFDPDGVPITRPATVEVTLRHLLTHTSGHGYDIWNSDLARWFRETRTPPIGSRRLATLDTPLLFDPGTRWNYGIGLDWVGQLVEAVSGQTLGQYLAEHITGPLGMVDTAFEPTAPMVERMAGMHTRTPDGGLAPIETTTPEGAEFELGGGGLFGTMPDYGRFLRMMLGDGSLDGRRVLAADTVELMAANAMGPLRVTPLRSAAPNLSVDADLFPGEESSWGLSFQRHEQPGATGRAVGTLSWAGLANSYFWIDRASGVAGAVMSQLLPFADERARAVALEVERAVYGT